MKASGEGAGTKAGLGVEESRADKTQESHNDDFENSFDLTCFKSKPSRPSGRKKGPSDTCESKRACVLLAYEMREQVDTLIFFAAFIGALSIFDISRPEDVI